MQITCKFRYIDNDNDSVQGTGRIRRQGGKGRQEAATRIVLLCLHTHTHIDNETDWHKSY